MNKQRPASAKGETRSPKTESDARYIDMVGPVKEVLLEVAARDVNAAPDALIFTTPTGAPIEHRNFDRRVWVPLMKRAGFWVPDSRDRRRGRPLYTKAERVPYQLDSPHLVFSVLFGIARKLRLTIKLVRH